MYHEMKKLSNGIEVPVIALGMIVLPKTANPEHMKQNAAVDFVISDDDRETLKRLEKIKAYGEHSIFPVFGGKL